MAAMNSMEDANGSSMAVSDTSSSQVMHLAAFDYRKFFVST